MGVREGEEYEELNGLRDASLAIVGLGSSNMWSGGRQSFGESEWRGKELIAHFGQEARAQALK
jgi:hypothetical protein